MDGRQPPEKVGIILRGVECMYGPQNTPMLWQCIIAITLECFKGHKHPQNLQKLYPLAWGSIAHPFKALAWSTRPHVGRKGAISASGGHGCGGCDASCVCSMATEKYNKNTKISCFYAKLFCLLYIEKHITIHVTLIVSWPETKSLWSNATPAYWVSPESSCHVKNN
jgi:hypothetical protein